MNDTAQLHFQRLPLSQRMTFTLTLMVLGLGYLFAMIHVFASHAGRDGSASLSVNDLVIAYSGSESDTRLESALKGPMQGMLPHEERAEIIAWVRSGAEKPAYESEIAPVVEKRCLACHDGANPHVLDLSTYEGVTGLTEADTGMDIFTLVRVSHIHLFGITFIFFITSMIFSHVYMRPLWMKCLVIAVPFIAIALDVASWYLTKIYRPFAWVVLISGGFMGLAFAIQWIMSIWQMWFYRLPEELRESDGVLPSIIREGYTGQEA
ncbi:MAG: hypothetical protein U9R74_06855 [Pseudomonadota bacterium]|nr:hypothetical protein [Pseudomonadota bacterium]